jgi:hypothetical protein
MNWQAELTCTDIEGNVIKDWFVEVEGLTQYNEIEIVDAVDPDTGEEVEMVRQFFFFFSGL